MREGIRARTVNRLGPAPTHLPRWAAGDTVVSPMDTTVTWLRRRLTALWSVLSGMGRAAPAASANPRVLPAYAALARYQRGASDLNPRLRLLATQLAAERSRCRWCIDKGRHLWREAQLPLDALRALPHYETCALFSERERVALRFADALTRYTESDSGDDAPLDLAAAREHFSESEIAALTAAVAEMHFFNPITGALGADAEPRAVQTPDSSWGAPIGTSLRGFWL